MRIPVVVTPKSGRDEVVGWISMSDGQRELSVRVTAAPEKGKATKAVCKVLAAFFNVSKGSVSCVRGELSRHKMIEVDGDDASLEQKLATL